MTPKVKGWDELHLAENPAVELLQSLGYTYLTPDELELERGSTKVTILTDRLGAALKRLNPWLSDDNVTKAVKAVTQVPAASLAEANEAVYTSLTYGISLEQDRGDGRKSHTVRFIDFDTPSHNEWVVTRQYQGVRVEEARPARRGGVRQWSPARRHRVQEPDHWGQVEGGGGEAAPSLSGS